MDGMVGTDGMKRTDDGTNGTVGMDGMERTDGTDGMDAKLVSLFGESLTFPRDQWSAARKTVALSVKLSGDEATRLRELRLRALKGQAARRPTSEQSVTNMSFHFCELFIFELVGGKRNDKEHIKKCPFFLSFVWICFP
jgi:hypothetical protein